MSQDRNWESTSSAPAERNKDKLIRTDFLTAGCQYMFSREWGVLTEVPYWNRTFRTTDDGGDVVSSTHASLGDIRIKAIYSGFSPDMSSGLTLGLKLPTGDSTHPGFDRDTEIGTGSTDLLMGVFVRGRLPVGYRYNWFVNGQLDHAVWTQGDYHPGSDFNAIAGVYYSGLRFESVSVAPLAQITCSHHWHDTGSEADPDNSGYDRVLLSPGVEVSVAGFKVYADVGFPIYQRVNGDQLVAPELYTLRMSYGF